MAHSGRVLAEEGDDDAGSGRLDLLGSAARGRVALPAIGFGDLETQSLRRQFHSISSVPVHEYAIQPISTLAETGAVRKGADANIVVVMRRGQSYSPPSPLGFEIAWADAYNNYREPAMASRGRWRV